MWRLLSFGYIVVVIAPICLAQSSVETPSPLMQPHKLEFDVASVRENKSGGQASSNVPLDRGDAFSATGGIFAATNQSLVTLLIFAYKINISEFRGGLMRSLPSWAITDKFDINARAESQAPRKQDMRLMMQSLLEDRFKLKVHREKREMPALGLYRTKTGRLGPQLKPHNPSSSCSAPLSLPSAGTPVSAMLGVWPPACGDGAEVRTSKYRLNEGGRNMTMNAIADWLDGSADSDRPILNATGLNGVFDFVLEFDPESIGREGMSVAPHNDSGPTFSEAIKEQLGLQLKKEEGAITIFVVDHVEYPSSN